MSRCWNSEDLRRLERAYLAARARLRRFGDPGEDALHGITREALESWTHVPSGKSLVRCAMLRMRDRRKDPQYMSPGTSSESPCEFAERGETARRVRSEVAVLRERDRLVAELVMDDMTFREVAVALGLHLEQVLRARKRIESRLSDFV